GNVRELEHRIKRAVIMADRKVLSTQDLELEDPAGDTPTRPLRDVRDEAERGHILAVLKRCGGNISQAATVLAVSRPTLHELIKKYQIQRGEE
ncbi:MAG: helix-turn-helix domain-containing protein, partial [Nitrospiria bacterium]